MNREYVQWYSTELQKKMELLVFGSGGDVVLFFPARMGRFYDYEDWKIIEALKPKIEKEAIQIFCVDSIDAESLYNPDNLPTEKIKRHLQYEQYILKEVFPFIRTKNHTPFMVAAGCSLGAYHAVNISLKHPQLFKKVVGMSGRYDLTIKADHYQDLFNGYWDENIYYNMPVQYISNLTDADLLAEIKKMDIILAVGQEDVLLENNQNLIKLLQEKGATPSLYIWEKQAHRAKSWRQMVVHYL